MKRKQLYQSSERVFYLIVAQVCKTCLKQMKDFSHFKAKYTAEYVNAILQNLAVVKAMPSYESRTVDQKTLRKSLITQNKSICRTFQRLLRYMKDGFEPGQLEDMRRAAGGDLYEAAAGKNWKASSDMQADMSLFMKKYETELVRGGMPDDFAPVFAELSTSFANTLEGFGTDRTTAGQETKTKLDANNGLYQQIRDVMDDGREIYYDNPPMMEQFSYQWLAVKLGGQGDTGFRFSLAEAGTLVPLTRATVSFLPSGLDFSIGEEAGVIPAYLPELKKNEFYNYLLTAPGYEEVAGTLVATTGVMHRVDLVLKRAVMSVEVGSDVKKIG